MPVKAKEIRTLQERFKEQLRLAKNVHSLLDIRESDDEYALLLNTLEEIVVLRQTRAEQTGLRDLRHENLVDQAEAIVRGVPSGYIRQPGTTRIVSGRIIGSCYPGESAHYYSDFTPKEVLDVELEFKKYVRNGYKIPAIWVLPLYQGGQEVYYVIDGHGRSSLANCIGKPTYARIFR